MFVIIFWCWWLTEGGEVEALLLQALVGSRAFGPVFVSGLLPPAAAATASATVASALVSVHVSIVLLYRHGLLEIDTMMLSDSSANSAIRTFLWSRTHGR